MDDTPVISDELDLPPVVKRKGKPHAERNKELRFDLRDTVKSLVSEGKLTVDPSAHIAVSTGLPDRRRNPTHLAPYQFKPGHSGNPHGRPRKLTEAYSEILCQEVPDEMLKGRFAGLKGSGISFADMIAYNQALLAAFSNHKKSAASIQAAKEIADRTEGKVVQRVETNINVTHSEMTSEERRHRILELARKSGDIIEGEFVDIPQLPDSTD